MKSPPHPKFLVLLLCFFAFRGLAAAGALDLPPVENAQGGEEEYVPPRPAEAVHPARPALKAPRSSSVARDAKGSSAGGVSLRARPLGKTSARTTEEDVGAASSKGAERGTRTEQRTEQGTDQAADQGKERSSEARRARAAAAGESAERTTRAPATAEEESAPAASDSSHESAGETAAKAENGAAAATAAPGSSDESSASAAADAEKLNGTDADESAEPPKTRVAGSGLLWFAVVFMVLLVVIFVFT